MSLSKFKTKGLNNYDEKSRYDMYVCFNNDKRLRMSEICFFGKNRAA